MNAQRFLRVALLIAVAVLLGLLVASVTAASAPPITSGSPPSGASATLERAIGDSLPSLPLRFVVNAGQAPPEVHFAVAGTEYALLFAEDETILRVAWQKDVQTVFSTVRLSYPGANPHPKIEGVSPLPGAANYFLGSDAAQWHTNVPTYAAVAYRNLYPGVDLVYSGVDSQLKREFQIAPGSRPALIRMAYTGMETLRISDGGALVLRTESGEWVEQPPLIYQMVDGTRQAVSGGYVLLPPTRLGMRTCSDPDAPYVGVKVGDYDPSRPLIIDPALTFSTYLGGDRGDNAKAIAVDKAGNIYMAGDTNSFQLFTVDPIQPHYAGGQDAYVIQLVRTSGVYTYGFCTYLGGIGQESLYGMAVDGAGNVYLAGETLSDDFPTHNAISDTRAGSVEGFVTQIVSESGACTLGLSTYLGTTGWDAAYAIAVDEARSIYITGMTTSRDFPTNRAIQPEFGGSADAFVTQLVSTSDVYTYGYSSYLGGTSYDVGISIVVDSAGNLYVAGETSAGFPVYNAIQPVPGGGIDVFVTQLVTASGAYTYNYSSYIGGNFRDDAPQIFVDDTGSIYVVGTTGSKDFPTLNPIQGTFAQGERDAFVAKLVAGSPVYTYAYSTYLGGTSLDCGGDIVANDAGNAFVTGWTESEDFFTKNALDTSLGGPVDAFVVQIVGNSPPYTLGYSTYLGGSSADTGYGIAVDSKGAVYVAGSTMSWDFPTRNTLKSLSGENDAFVVRLGEYHRILFPAVMRRNP